LKPLLAVAKQLIPADRLTACKIGRFLRFGYPRKHLAHAPRSSAPPGQLHLELIKEVLTEEGYAPGHCVQGPVAFDLVLMVFKQ
jgi:hypothetical protein